MTYYVAFYRAPDGKWRYINREATSDKRRIKRAREIIAWEIAKGVLAIVFWLFAVCVVAIALYCLCNVRDRCGECVPFSITAIVGSVTLTLTFAMAVVPTCVYSVQAYITPKLVIMQYLHGLLK